MDLGSLIRLLIRRAYVAVPLLLITATAGLSVANTVQPDYEVTGALILLGPSVELVELESGDIEIQPENPLLTLGGSLGTVSEALSLRLGSQRVRAEFASKGYEPSYEIGADSRSPIMQFRVKADSPELPSETLEALMDWVEDELKTSQAEYGLGPEKLMSVQRLSNENEATPGWTNRRRAQLLLLGSAGLFTLLVTAAFDALLVRRRRGRADRINRRRNAANGRGGGDPTHDTGVDSSFAAPRSQDVVRSASRTLPERAAADEPIAVVRSR